jgi:hypothetical protein
VKTPTAKISTVVWGETMVESACISRFLNVNGFPSAVDHVAKHGYAVRVAPKHAAKARKLMKKRKRGDCGLRASR